MSRYEDSGIDARVTTLVLTRQADGTEHIDCPVCECPVAARPTDTLRRYGDEPQPNYATGLYEVPPSPSLLTLSCGHQVELPGAPA